MNRICLAAALLILFFHPASASSLSRLGALAGKKDALLVTGDGGKILLSKHEDIPLIPASTLKIFTALLAMHHLGPGYRFSTDFYMDPDNRLKVKGFGDPLWVSESISIIAKILAGRLQAISGIFLDDTYFTQPLEIPGVTDSFEPYDAPNGALCANFNTVFFEKTGLKFSSAEHQTPLLPMVMNRIRKSRLNKGRVVLSNKNGEAVLYAGLLLRYFLEKEGVVVSGGVERGRVIPARDRLILHHSSRYDLMDILQRLLEHSNNFIANQLLITVGAKAFGPPGSLDKGVRAAMRYASDNLETNGIQIVEGSGISRENRITATAMHRILERFLPYRRLMVHQNDAFFKTGTLNGVRSLAGYIEKQPGKIYPFVILINTPGKTADPILAKIQARLP